MTEIIAITACHNRRRLTERALVSLRDACIPVGLRLTVVLYDDGSTDGTVDAVRKIAGIRLEVISGDGSAFWASSMAAAEARALELADEGTKAILWLNDDVEVDRDALLRTTAIAAAKPGALLVGGMRDPGTGLATYSGYRKKRFHPLRMRIVSPGPDARQLDTIHGNFVWVPVQSALLIGGIDGNYAHAMADIDYGFRANGLGVPVWLMPGTFGQCESNLPKFEGSLWIQWKTFTSRKGGGDWYSMKRILQKNTGAWWLFAGYSYLGWWARALVRRSRLRKKEVPLA